MKVSLNWVRLLNEQYKCAADPAPHGIDNLVEKIGLQLGAVEEVINLGERYKGALVAKVISAEKHPNADKLKVCWIDDGRAAKKVERNKDGHIQVVCGASNVKAGQLVVWLPPGTTVPATYDKDPFVLESREIRGQVSNGMIASAKELALGDSHEGILVIDTPAKAGQAFADVYQLNDYIIDIENKMFTHRPDCFGVLGIAREIAGIQNHMFVSPLVYKQSKSSGKYANQRLKLKIQNDIPELVPRFVALAFYNIKVRPSDIWMQSYLARVDIRPINNIVDITNYFMMLTGQPLHAYDYDKVKTGIVGARLSKKGEKLRLLGGKQITLKAGAVVITDGQKPIGLGGIMGGADTEVDEHTKNIILECANFDMNLTRKTAMEYGLFTDAATRFTKNQSPWQNDRVVAWAATEITYQAGGEPDGFVHDERGKLAQNPKIKLSADFVNSRLGTKLSATEMKKILENVEFEVDRNGELLSATAPFWRTDIHIPEDLVEEVGRLYGYDKLPIVLPGRDLSPPGKDQLLVFKSYLRQILARAGANEVLTYSFVQGSLLEKVGQDPKTAYHIRNALSPDLQYFRLSLTPSLLEKIHPNIRAGFSQFALFELGKGHNQKMREPSDPALPMEFEMLSLVTASKTKSVKSSGAPFFQAKRILDYLASELSIKFEYRPIKEEEPYPVSRPFDHSRSAQVWVGDVAIGMVGEYRQSVIANLKLPPFCAGFEIGITQLLQVRAVHGQYRPLNRFPELEQDFNLRASADQTYQELTDFISQNLAKLSTAAGYQFEIQPLDIFQKEADKTHKQTTWRIILWHPERTLTTEETNKLLDELADLAKKRLKAERI